MIEKYLLPLRQYELRLVFLLSQDFTWLPIPSAPIIFYPESNGHAYNLHIFVFVKKFSRTSKFAPSQLFSLHAMFIPFNLLIQNLLLYSSHLSSWPSIFPLIRPKVLE